MSNTVAGVVTNGVVVTDAALPEGARVEISLRSLPSESPAITQAQITPAELRRLPREERQAILAAAAEVAEPVYRDDRELTGFEAFCEELLDDGEADSR